MLQPGDILVGRYRIVRPLARGGMGAVYEARDERLKRSVALKETLISEAHLPHAFEHEATLLANLNHPALPKVFDHFAENDGQYIIMEYIPGDDLEKLLQKRGQPFSIAEVESWYGQLLDALTYLHAHTIIHRDLKPANLKVRDNGGIILLDFGLAKGSAGYMTQASHQSILGYTPVYAPLEQIRCEGTSPASDLYSLGATMYRLLTNTAPIDAQKRELTLLKTGRDPLRPLAEVRPDVPPQFAEMLTQSLKLEAGDRPASASAMTIASGHQVWSGAHPFKPSDTSRVDQKEQPTVLFDQATERAGQRTSQAARKPMDPIAKLVRPSLVIPAGLALLLLIWFAFTHISSNRGNVAATPSSSIILPLTAENRSLYAGIEIGAKGVKATVLQVDTTKGTHEAKALMPVKTFNTTLMSGVAETGRFSPEAIDDTAKGVQKLFAQMRDQFKVATERIHIIGSSGLKKPDGSDVENKDELVQKIQNATGTKMSFLDAEQEVRDSIAGTVPTEFLRTGILIDIGSGNTKGGYQEGNSGDDQFVTMTLPHGTVSFTDEIAKRSGTADNFSQQAEELRTEILLPAFRQELGRKPGLINRRRVYLSGGIVWAMVTLLHPSNREANVNITADDINAFTQRALSADESLLNPTLSGIQDTKTRQEAEEDVQRVKESFSPQNLVAGAELLQAAYSEFKLADKEVYFSRYNSMGWGWLLTYIKSEASEEKKN